MKTAKDCLRASAQILDLAELMKGAEGDKYFVTRQLTIVHLRQAAKLAKEIGQAMEQDQQKAGTLP